MATQMNNLQSMILFLEHDADANLFNEVTNTTPLQFAARRCHFEMLKLLINFGAKLNITDYVGSSFLKAVDRGCNEDIIHYLLDEIPEEKGMIKAEPGDEMCYHVDTRDIRKVIILNWRNNRMLSLKGVVNCLVS